MKKLIIILLFTSLATMNLLSQNIGWKNANGTNWDAIKDVKIDSKGKIFVATYTGNIDFSQGTIYRSDDSGKTWKNLHVCINNYGVNQILITKNGLLIAVQDLNGISISSDDGETWINLKNQFAYPGVLSIVELSTGTIIACTNTYGVYKSEDGGYTWIPISLTIYNGIDLTQLFAIHDILFKLQFYDLYRSTDFGNSWQIVKKIDNNKLLVYSSVKNDNIYFIVYGDSTFYYMNYKDDSIRILKSNLNGKNYIYNFTNLSFYNDNRIIALTQNVLFISDTLLENWQPLIININNVNASNFTYIGIKNDKIYLGTSSGNLIILDYDLNKHYAVSKNLFNKKITGLLTDSNFTICIIDSISINISLDTCKSWYPLTEENPDFKSVKGIVIDSNRKIYALIDTEFVKIDFDRTRNIINDGLKGKIINIVNDKQLNIYATTDSGIYKFNLINSIWELFNKNVKNCSVLNKKNNFVLLKDSINIKLLNTKNNKIYTFNNLPDIIHKVTIGDVSIDSTIFIGFKNVDLFRSSDFGNTWEKADNQLTNKNFTSILSIDNQKALVGTATNGIYYSNNNGKIWETDNKSLSSIKISALDNISDKSIYAGTSDNGLFTTDSIFNNKIKFLSGWEDSTLYKQQKCVLSPISRIKFSSDSKRFITFSGDNTLRIWDVETGYLLSEFHLIFTIMADCDLNENEQWIAIATNDSLGYQSKWNSYIYDYFNDKIISSYGDLTRIGTGWPHYTYTNKKILFANNGKEYINNLAIYEDAGSDSQNYGVNYLYELDSNKNVWSFGIGSSTYMKMSKKSNKVYFNGHTDYYHSQGHGGGSGESNISYIINIDSMKYGIYSGFNNTVLVDFSSDDNYLAYRDDSKKQVVLYNFANSKFEASINYINTDANNILYDIAFGYGNLDLYLSTTNKLYHWSYNKGTIVDSFNLPGLNGETWQLSCSKDGKYLLAASNLGHIRIWDIYKVMSIGEKISESRNNIKYYPNPANEFLFIDISYQSILPAKICIYDIYGKLKYSDLVKNSLIRVNTSQFTNGIYFLTVISNNLNFYDKFIIFR